MTPREIKFKPEILLLVLIFSVILTIIFQCDFITTGALHCENPEVQLAKALIALTLLATFFLLFTVRRSRQLGSCHCKLLDTLRQLNKTTSKDRLTGLGNRRYFIEIAERDFELALYNDQLPTILLVEIEQFQHINEHYGINSGDEIIIKTANLIAGQCEKSDVIARYRGQTFILLKAHCTMAAVQLFADQLHSQISTTPIQIDKFSIPIRVAIGIGQRSATNESLYDVIGFAEHALRQAKKSEQLAVVCYQPAATTDQPMA